MKKIMTITLVAGALSLIAAGVAFASTNDPRIQQRELNQDKRIDQGVASGQLTPKEAGRVEAQQAKIKQDEARMKADGKLTKKERAKLTREQNRASRTIYRQKHDQQRARVN